MPRASAARPPTEKPITASVPAEVAEPTQELTEATEQLPAWTKPERGGWDNPLGFITIEETNTALNICLYGKEGSTKTTSAALLANTGPGRVLFINAEGGLKKGPLKKRGVHTDKIVVWPNPATGQRITRAGLQEVYERLQADLIKDPRSWTGVVFDSATEIHVAILDEVAAKRVQKGTDLGKTGDAVDPYFTDRGDYGTMSKMFRDLLRKFRDLPCHFVLTALERRDVDEDTSKVTYGPAVTPGLQSDIMGYVDMVLAYKAPDGDKPARCLTKKSGLYRAKDRLDVLPAVLNEPGLDRVIAYYEGEITEETDPLQNTDQPSKTPATTANEEKN